MVDEWWIDNPQKYSLVEERQIPYLFSVVSLPMIRG